MKSLFRLKVSLQTKLFDTANAFDNTTNYRFQPTVAGYYQINFGVRAYVASGSITGFYAILYKNSARYRVGGQAFSGSFGNYPIYTGSDLVYMNGSTDYLELWGNITGTSPIFNYNDNTSSSYFSGYLARSA